MRKNLERPLNWLSARWRPVTLIVLIVISALTLTPLPQLPEVAGSDKTHHIIAYAVLMFPAFLAHHTTRFFLFSLFLLWSGVIELLQPYVNRYGEMGDVYANVLGLILGALGGWRCRKFV